MTIVGDLIHAEVKAGKEAIVEQNFRELLERVQREPATLAWFAFRLGTSIFGNFAVFSNEQGRQAHFSEEALARMEQGNELLARPRVMEKAEVLVAKLPEKANPVTVGLITRFEAWPGKEADVERTIKAALSVIQKEPGTIAWFPMRLSASTFGVFDVFPDEESRQAHLSVGERSLRARSMELVEQSLRIEKIDILAAKLPGSGL